MSSKSGVVQQTQAPQQDAVVYDLLIIDDDPFAIQFVKDILRRETFSVFGATRAAEGLDSITENCPQIVLLDLLMPDVQGMELLDQILRIDPSIDVILVTGHYSTESAVEAIQKGAYDYWTKPLEVNRVRQKLTKWAVDKQIRQRTNRLDSELLVAFQLEGIVGRSPMMQAVFSKIRRIAPHFLTALVTGETGTGKESAAKALHRLSPFASGPFVVCNCAAIPELLFESELFGHVRGAFTGATQDKQGFAEAAGGGTLFLDEITEIPLGTQAKLLRLLQNREIQRVGSTRSQHIDVRIVAATNRDPRNLVSEGKLREDLFYRLSMIEIVLPRLVDRREDLPLLERHFLDRFSQLYAKPTLNLTPRVQGLVTSHPWPGNIRELENVLGYGSMMTERNTIDISDLPEYMQRRDLPEERAASVIALDPQTAKDHVFMSMQALDLQHLHSVLDHVGGDRARAAEILKISRTTVYRRLKRGT